MFETLQSFGARPDWVTKNHRENRHGPAHSPARPQRSQSQPMPMLLGNPSERATNKQASIPLSLVFFLFLPEFPLKVSLSFLKIPIHSFYIPIFIFSSIAATIARLSLQYPLPLHGENAIETPTQYSAAPPRR